VLRMFWQGFLAFLKGSTFSVGHSLLMWSRRDWVFISYAVEAASIKAR